MKPDWLPRLRFCGIIDFTEVESEIIYNRKEELAPLMN